MFFSLTIEIASALLVLAIDQNMLPLSYTPDYITCLVYILLLFYGSSCLICSSRFNYRISGLNLMEN